MCTSSLLGGEGDACEWRREVLLDVQGIVFALGTVLSVLWADALHDSSYDTDASCVACLKMCEI